MWTSYQDIYAALYRWSLKQWGGDEYMASFLTACTLAGAIGMNVALAVGVYTAVCGPFQVGPVARVAFYLGAAALLGMNYFALVWNHRYVAIVERFSTRPRKQRKAINVVAWVYLIASYGTPLVFFFYMAARVGQL